MFKNLSSCYRYQSSTYRGTNETIMNKLRSLYVFLWPMITPHASLTNVKLELLIYPGTIKTHLCIYTLIYGHLILIIIWSKRTFNIFIHMLCIFLSLRIKEKIQPLRLYFFIFALKSGFSSFNVNSNILFGDLVDFVYNSIVRFFVLIIWLFTIYME